MPAKAPARPLSNLRGLAYRWDAGRFGLKNRWCRRFAPQLPADRFHASGMINRSIPTTTLGDAPRQLTGKSDRTVYSCFQVWFGRLRPIVVNHSIFRCTLILIGQDHVRGAVVMPESELAELNPAAALPVHT